MSSGYSGFSGFSGYSGFSGEADSNNYYKLDYNFDEIYTEKKHIDDSVIYKKCFIIDIPYTTITFAKIIPHNISNLGVITSIEGILFNRLYTPNLQYYLNSSNGTYYNGKESPMVTVDSSSITIFDIATVGYPVDYKVIVYLEYTKIEAS